MPKELPSDHPLRALAPETAMVHRAPRYSFPNLANDGPAALVDQDDEAETYLFGGTRMECKGRCGRWTWHDIYVEVTGMVEISAEVHANCRDCGTRQEGSVKSGIGAIQPSRLAIEVRDPKARERARQQRRARRRNR